MFFPVLPFSSDLECYRLIKFDQLWCQVWADLGWAKHFLLTFVSRPVWANTASQLRFRRLRFYQFWPYLVSHLTRFRLGRAFFMGCLSYGPFEPTMPFMFDFQGYFSAKFDRRYYHIWSDFGRAVLFFFKRSLHDLFEPLMPFSSDFRGYFLSMFFVILFSSFDYQGFCWTTFFLMLPFSLTRKAAFRVYFPNTASQLHLPKPKL